MQNDGLNLLSNKDIVIRLENIIKKYKNNRIIVLDNLSLSVRRNEIYGFIGINGAGKTTTIKIILNLLKPDYGDVLLFNKKLSSESLKKIGFSPENPVFPDKLTVYETLELSAKLLDASVQKEKFNSILNELCLIEYKDFYASDLSKGLKQRLALACAMIHDPELYVLDEPASGLDPIGRRLIKEIIKKLKNQGKTVFFSTHILSDVIEICDRFGIIHRGKIIYEQAANDFRNGYDNSLNNLEKLFISITSEQKFEI